MLSPEKEHFKGASLFYWATIVALLAVAFISTWSCSAWKSEAEIKQSHLRESLVRLEQASTEIDKGNSIIRERDEEIRSAKIEIERLNRDLIHASQIVQKQHAALECYAKKSDDEVLLSFLGNLILPGVGGAIGSTLGQQREC